MPLDTAAVTDDFGLLLGTGVQDQGRESPIERHCPSISSCSTIGAALKAIREFRGLEIEDVAEATRVRPTYLRAIEEMRLEGLPSRPFVVGYVRAYAKALHCDPEIAAARFRKDAPDEDGALRAPVGVHRHGDPRLALLLGVGAVVVAAVAAWNVAQHSSLLKAPSRHVSPDIAQSAARSAELPPPAATRGPVSLGAPLPAPAESTTPAPYVTPGLEAATGGSSAEPAASAATPATTGDAPPEPTPFVATGAVYGPSTGLSNVILQASKPTSLVIHGPDGAVYFAKELAAGEAYRVPAIDGLSLDVSDPQATNYFVGGMLKGVLPAAHEPVSDLNN